MSIKTLIIDTQSKITGTYHELEGRGLSVYVVRKDSEIFSALYKFDPSVILIDEAEPEPNKTLLFSTIRSMSSAPILVLSVFDGPKIVEQILDHGADEYLTKQLKTRMNAFIIVLLIILLVVIGKKIISP